MYRPTALSMGAINRRCQASKVSGVTIVAMCRKDPLSECLGFRRQTTALIVREPQTPGADLFPLSAVLFLETVDEIALLLVDPTGERDEHEPERIRRLTHGGQATQWSSAARRPIQEPRSVPNGYSVVASIGFLDGGQSQRRAQPSRSCSQKSQLTA
jgi:hypothetical protein